jgi:endonuclease YncB( thermonuclease family)
MALARNIINKEGYNINASLVCARFAWWYERYAPDNELLESCQKEAQGAPKGLWEDSDPHAALGVEKAVAQFHL